MSDAINPDHYKRLPAEAIEIIESAIEGAPTNRDALLHGQALKYLLRCWNKNGIEDLKKAKWYLDRLIDSFDTDSDSVVEESSKKENRQPTELHGGLRPDDNVALAMRMAANSFGRNDGVFNGAGFANAMRQLAGVTCNLLDGYVVATILDGRTDVEVLKGGSHYKYLFWSPGNTQSIEQPAEAPEVTVEVKPPDGWRFLEVGEVIRKGDRCFTNNSGSIDCLASVGEKFNREAHYPTIRRNQFEVGEKVVRVLDEFEFVIIDKHNRFNDVYVARNKMTGKIHKIQDRLLAPYIEETT